MSAPRIHKKTRDITIFRGFFYAPANPIGDMPGATQLAY
jgi:hypothetical protein